LVVRILDPTPFIAEAAHVLAVVRDEVVIVGAAALEVALAEEKRLAITPTRDVDVVVPTERAEVVISLLEAADMDRSEVPHERGFTWVRGDLKVQLVRTFHPFPTPPARKLPGNPVFGMARGPAHQVRVAFADDPIRHRLTCANAACLLALKQAAFGRTRPTDDEPVERDFHDAFLLISGVPNSLVDELRVAGHEVRHRAADAIAQLAAGANATAAAGRQMVRLGDSSTQRVAEAEVRRAASRIQRTLDARRTATPRSSLQSR
jgi:hypothetical protein